MKYTFAKGNFVEVSCNVKIEEIKCSPEEGKEFSIYQLVLKAPGTLGTCTFRAPSGDQGAYARYWLRQLFREEFEDLEKLTK